MIQTREDRHDGDHRILGWGYGIILFFLTLTGFGQMPIFKRYYIADIPGLGWLAKFYVTHYIHYIGAVLLLALIAYRVVEHLTAKQSGRKLTASGYVRGILLGGISITGIFLVIRNLKDIWFPPGFIIFLDVTHLGLVMVFILAVLYCRLSKKPWTHVL